MPPEFVPTPPAGFQIAGTFNGVTTAVGSGGEFRIRYQLTGVKFPSGGLVGFAMRQVLKIGVGDEVALGSLHTRLSFALMMVGDQPETGVVERLDDQKPNGFVLGRYRDRKSGDTKFGGMALLKAAPGIVEILVTECDTEQMSRELTYAAMAPYLSSRSRRWGCVPFGNKEAVKPESDRFRDHASWLTLRPPADGWYPLLGPPARRLDSGLDDSLFWPVTSLG